MRGGSDPGKRSQRSGRVRDCRELIVFQNAMDAAMRVFLVSKTLPSEERYSLIDQMRRSSRSVCSNIAEAWRKRQYPAHFVSKLTDAAGEAEETRVWLEFAHRCGYVPEQHSRELDDRYGIVLGQLTNMISRPQDWAIT